MLAYYVHDLSPFVLRFGPNFGIRWYGFSYVLAFLVGFWLFRRLARKGYSDLPPERAGDFITLAALAGVLLGGRVGYILFYRFDEFLRDPLMALKVWEGGMSSHGGILGLLVFTLIYSRVQRISWTDLGDNLVVVAPLGILFGRLANFINGELWGRPATVPWAVICPKAPLVDDAHRVRVDTLGIFANPRHPSQIYQALLEGALLFAVLFLVRMRIRTPNGILTGLFFVLYAVLRIVGEVFREPDPGAALILGLTRGQFLSLFMIAIGAGFIVQALRKRQYPKRLKEAASGVTPDDRSA